VIRQVTDEEKKLWGYYKEMYAGLCKRYKTGLIRLDLNSKH
jgi:hypothetical protein